MNFVMSPTFPQDAFQQFGEIASSFFPGPVSDENLYDPCAKLTHFQGAWLAVRYRYQACWEQNEAFKVLFADAMASDLYREWSVGEEYNYPLEQSVYTFFTNALSVFESLGFCLYFLGAMIDPKKENFPDAASPKRITLKATCTAFNAGFSYASISSRLMELLKDSGFKRIEDIRNILAHRLVGRRHIRDYGTTRPDGIRREEFWHIIDLGEDLEFNDELLQRHFNEVNSSLTELIMASLEFVKSLRPAAG